MKMLTSAFNVNNRRKKAGADLGQTQFKIGELGKLMSSPNKAFFLSFCDVIILSG